MTVPVKIDDQAYLCPSWSDMGELTVKLAQKISSSGIQFDRVVALAKGGLSWNRQLQDLLQIKHTSSIQVRFYQGINHTSKRPIVTQSLPVSIEDQAILIFDDVADTGESLILAKQYLDQHGAHSMHTATIYEKPWSKVKPDFVADTTDAWVIFPHDAIENMKLVAQKWQVSGTQLAQRFSKIGLESSLIDFYLASVSHA